MTNKKHYIDNDVFFKAMSEWKLDVIIARNKNQPDPPVTDYIGECFLKICENIKYRPNFINYTYHDDMVSDGLESCLLYAHNFNPDKSKNAFSYFTQIVFYAYVRRIKKEQKQSFVRYKVIEHEGLLNNTANHIETADESDKKILTAYTDYLKSHDHYGEMIEKQKKKREKKKQVGGLEDFL